MINAFCLFLAVGRIKPTIGETYADLTFEVTMYPWHLYILSPFYGILQTEDRHIFQERYMMAFLFEYAATLGLIDVGYIHPFGARRKDGDLSGTDELDCLSRYDGLMYLRLNNLGAWCPGCAREYEPTPVTVEPFLKVLPNLEIAVMAPSLMPADRLALAQFAEQTSDAIWKLDAETLLKSVEAGHSIADMAALYLVVEHFKLVA